MNAHDIANALEKRELEAMEYGFDKELFDATNMLRQQADRIAELEKENDVKEFSDDFINTIRNFKFPSDTTPQTKPLSDEEMWNICVKGGYVDCIADTDFELDGMEEFKRQYVRLARAIEAKVREEK